MHTQLNVHVWCACGCTVQLTCVFWTCAILLPSTTEVSKSFKLGRQPHEFFNSKYLLVSFSSVLCVVEAEVTAVGCNTLKVSYTVNPLPGGGNEATLRSLVVKYRPILGAGSTGTRSVTLNGTATEGVLCFSGLFRDTGYRVTYSVEVDVGFQTTLPSDLSEPVELLTGRNCDQQQLCQENSRPRTITTAPPATSCTTQPLPTCATPAPTTTSTTQTPTPSGTRMMTSTGTTTIPTTPPPQGECST